MWGMYIRWDLTSPKRFICLKGRLLDIHVHDATLQKDFRKATHLPTGKGTINFSDFVNILR
ncbi:MAG: hypothetical protein ACTSYM_07365 [Candidatus Baldrarchaeia archaeon]